MFEKNEQEKIRTIKINTFHKGTYQAIMRCDTIDEIVETIYQLEGYLEFIIPEKQQTPQWFHSWCAQKRDKIVTFANDSLFPNNIAELGEKIGNKIASKLNDKMSELANKQTDYQ